jgi:DNA polymerase-3 subunit delta'
MWLPEYLDKEGNILLKIIEEPPQKTLFLLVAQDQDQLLNTLLSRVQLVKIGRLSDQDIERYLVVQHGVLQTRAMQIAYLSEGNLQVALSLLNEAESDYFNLFSNWMRIATADKGVQIIDFVEQVGKMGRENQKHFLRYGIRLMVGKMGCS